MTGNEAVLIDFPGQKKKAWKRDKLNENKKGSVYERGGKLYVYFFYKNERVREPSGLADTEEHRRKLRLFLDKIHFEIDEGSFEFGYTFPYSKKKEHFTLLEGRTLKTTPEEVTFGSYFEKWMKEMKPGMTVGKIRDYQKIADFYLLPYFAEMPFSEFKIMTMKKFLAHLVGSRSRYGKPLAANTIKNVFIPLRAITADAFSEYDWAMPDPFIALKMPKRKKPKVNPFTFEDWIQVMGAISPWYKPYFEFAVNTGLRPSEQVALKWSAIDAEYIEVELSRVLGYEKEDLKTESSRRSIEIRPAMREILERQKKLTSHLKSEYVFLNNNGKPISQVKMSQLWGRAMKRANLPHRRMYEIRHTFASWALAAGEQPGWVAKTLGHTDLTMVYTVYARFIPALKKDDGGKFESMYAKKHLL
ncbi:integrase [Desulfoluna limicola]|uniref:Integrase n=1 Tax=Desulfoluna limicola TaxID=2810562 RepID=A0ABN6EW42_9BACT|nr:tyrosine-type recombinase/integrase [Desulfoluna limicola]BCS94553.1 integrase [Desulfoluna limicola]